ncbi:MAG: hypothetical protein ACHP65_06795 [Legionellales bacterium]
MKKLFFGLFAGITLSLLASCTVDTVTYDPGYSNDYVYSVGYYNNRPYWGNNYYRAGANYGNYGYWGGGDYSVY